MPRAECKFIKRLDEFLPKTEISNVPANTRGIYALLKEKEKDSFDVVYIGLSAWGKECGIASRLRKHNRKKGVEWTHFTIFEVHDNISDNEICELEGLFRHIYRKDTTANRLNKQVRYKKFNKISKSLKKWDKKD
jgi:hypothetical protein